MAESMFDIGEKAFLERLLPELPVDPVLVNGFGHDASVIDLGFDDTLLALKIDRAPRPIAAERRWASYSMWGRLAVTAVCSDLLTVGAVPRAVMIAVTVPGSWAASDVRDVVLGCAEECQRNGVAFVGGDTKEGSSPNVVASGVGVVARSAYLGRAGVRPGQVAVLAGTLGGFLGSYLQVVRREGPSGGDRAEWIRYLAEPSAQWRLAGRVTRELGITAGMDLSDGLYEALETLTAEGLGIEIDLDSLPYHPAAIECSETLGIPLPNLALGVGDWGILFAVDPDAVEQVTADMGSAGCQLTEIGRFNSSGKILARDRDGAKFVFQGFRNEHFRLRMEDEKDYMRRVLSDEFLVRVG